MGEALQARDLKHRSSPWLSTAQGQIIPGKHQGVTHKPAGKSHSNVHYHQRREKESWEPGYRAPVSYSSLSSTRFSWGKGENAMRSPQLTQRSAAPSAAVTTGAFVTVLQGHEQADSTILGTACLSIQNLSYKLGPFEALRIPMHAKAACHSFLPIIIFGSSASPPLQGTGRGIKYETHFFKLGEITIENYPFSCLPLSPLLSLRSSRMLLSQRAKRSVFP